MTYRDQADASIKKGDVEGARQLLTMSLTEGLKLRPEGEGSETMAAEIDKLFAIYAKVWSMEHKSFASLSKEEKIERYERMLNEGKSLLRFGELQLGKDAPELKATQTSIKKLELVLSEAKAAKNR